MIITPYVILSPVDDTIHPRIGYRNLFVDGTVSASSEDADHPKELAYDGLTYDAWRSEGSSTEWLSVSVSPSEAADYMAVAAHTLAGCTLTPQYSDDNGGSWNDLSVAFVPSDNAPIIWEFDEVTGTNFRLLIESASEVVSVGAIHVGSKFVLPRGFPFGWRPPSLNEDTEYTNAFSQGGQLLGRNIVRRGAEVSGQSANALYTWARDDWQDFIDVAELRAFFFWRTWNDRSEIVYGALTGREVATSNRKHVTASFSMRGISR